MADGWRPPATFNLVASLVALAASCGLAFMAWQYYEYSPWARDGRVRVYTVQVAPEVSGTVVELPVRDNQFIHKGDLLYKIDPGTFQNQVTIATGQLAEARARASYLTGNAVRQNNLPSIAASEQSKQDTAGEALAAQNQILAATGALSQAELNLSRTELRSTVNGWVTNLTLQRGGFAMTGQPAMTLVDADSFWVEGYFEETQIPRIAVGDEVSLILMAYPGHRITGHVSGFGRGISVQDAAQGVQGLPTVDPVFTWVRLAQRAPIRVALDDVPCPIVLFAGMTATVSVLDHPLAAGAPRPGYDPERSCGRVAR